MFMMYLLLHFLEAIRLILREFDEKNMRLPILFDV